MADPLQAIGDPNRRAILEALCTREHAVGELVDRFGLSQPATSQHLRVLRDAGLVRVRSDRQRRLYRADAEGLAALRAALERFWTAELEQAKRDVEDAPRGREERRRR